MSTDRRVFLSLLLMPLFAGAQPQGMPAQISQFIVEGEKAGKFKKMEPAIVRVESSADAESITVDVRYKEGRPSAVAMRAQTFAESLVDAMIDKYKRDTGSSSFPFKFYVNSWMATKQSGIQMRVLRTRFLPYKAIVESERKDDLVAVEPR